MPKLPVVSGKEVIKALGKIGYEIAKGTLLAIIKQAGLTREEFMKSL